MLPKLLLLAFCAFVVSLVGRLVARFVGRRGGKTDAAVTREKLVQCPKCRAYYAESAPCPCQNDDKQT